MFVNFNQPITLKNCLLFKARPRKEFHFNRVICLSCPSDLNSYTFVINSKDKSSITHFENQIKSMIPSGTFLNSPLANNIVTCKIPKSKGIVQTKIHNTNLDDKKNQYANVELYIDNFYSFQNNKKNYFYKIKVARIEFIP